MSQGLLAWTADPPDRSARSHLDAFRTLLLVHCATQSLAWAIEPPPAGLAFPPFLIYGAALLESVLVVAALRGRGRLASQIALPILFAQLVWIFPHAANHTGLVFALLGFCALCDLDDPEEERLLLQCLRWIAALVFVWAGLQKMLHGLYFRGEFLAWLVAQGTDRWSLVFGGLIGGEDLARLSAYAAHPIYSGPYRVASPLFVALSNSVWVMEIALGVGLLIERARHVCGLLAIALVFAIQSAPREFMFAFVYTNMLLLCVRGDWNRRLRWLFVALYAALIAALLGAPLGFLIRGSGTI